MTRIDDAALIAQFASALEAGEPIRRDFGRGERLHIDRALPFLVVHMGAARQRAARNAVTANSSYLLVRSRARAKAIIELIAEVMTKRFGAFIVVDMAELPPDHIAANAASLPEFDLTISTSTDVGAMSAGVKFAAAVENAPAEFRLPKVRRLDGRDDPAAILARMMPKIAWVTTRFAPIYQVPESKGVYPQLLESLVANIVDAGLQAIGSFVGTTKSLAISSHRALGRKAFIDVVERADRAIDEVAGSFDVLLAVTPINAAAAWESFENSGFEREPKLLYRPLSVDISEAKRSLHAIRLDHFEDPVLTALYREKQQELDLQLSLLGARETPRFIELGRALYGSVEDRLRDAARSILSSTKPRRSRQMQDEGADSAYLQRRATAMISRYAAENGSFSPTVELRDDLPSGLLVSGDKLLIARSTTMAKMRVDALLSHEIGVHLLTYFNGSAQGLRLFRTGLAGYEGVQEGLAVLAEYLVGGMTETRLRLLAARVEGCAAMLTGASFVDCYRLVTSFGLSATSAFNLVLRLYRGGGLAKDAVYLRGLLEVLEHLRTGGQLEPFWMGKIATNHFAVMQELSARGLLHAALVTPAFLSHDGAQARLEAATAGMSPIEMI